MEAEKLQRLHDTLSKLAPRGKVGGLGFSKVKHTGATRDQTLPQNALYSNFVRAGSGLGLYHKRTFEEVDKNDDDTGSSDKKKKKKKKATKEDEGDEEKSSSKSKDKKKKSKKQEAADEAEADGKLK